MTIDPPPPGWVSPSVDQATGEFVLAANASIIDWLFGLFLPPPVFTMVATDNGTPPKAAKCDVTPRLSLL